MIAKSIPLLDEHAVVQSFLDLPQVAADLCILVQKVTEVRYSESVNPIVICRVPVTFSDHQ